MDLKKYSKYLSRELFQMISEIEKGIGIETSELPPKNLMPVGARFLVKEDGVVKEYIKLSDGEYHLLGGGISNAREIELQKSATHIQWRYKNEIEWHDLVALNEITGPQGAAGSDGIDGQGIDHIEFTSTTAVSGLPNEPGETDTYTVWGDADETINLGTFTVYNGANGEDGLDGIGIPAGGITGQVLTKKSNNDYDTEWRTAESGGAGSIAELNDVDLEGLSNGKVLVYDSTLSLWKPQPRGITFGKFIDDSTIQSLSPTAWWDSLHQEGFYNDKSGNNNNLILDSSTSVFPLPAYEIRNGAAFPFVKFINNSMLMVNSNLYSQFSGSDKPITLFYVFRPYSLPSGNTVLFSIRGSSTTPLMNFYANGGSSHDKIMCFRRDDAGSNVTATGMTTLQINKLYLVTWVFNGTQIFARLNGQNEVNQMAMDVGTITLNKITISGFVTSQYLNGGLYEVIVFNSALSLSDVQTIENILLNKWDI